jgi:hypothetical protein
LRSLFTGRAFVGREALLAAKLCPQYRARLRGKDWKWGGCLPDGQQPDNMHTHDIQWLLGDFH